MTVCTGACVCVKVWRVRPSVAGGAGRGAERGAERGPGWTPCRGQSGWLRVRQRGSAGGARDEEPPQLIPPPSSRWGHTLTHTVEKASIMCFLLPGVKSNIIGR